MIGAEFGLLERHGLLQERHGAVELAGGLVAPAEVAHGEEGIEVVGAEPDLLDRQRLLVERQGEVEPVGGLVGDGEVVHGLEGFGVVGAELRLPEPQRFLVERQGEVEPVGAPIADGEAVHALEGIGVIGAELRLHEGQRLLEERHGAVELAGVQVATGEPFHALEGVGVVGTEVGRERGAGLGVQVDRPLGVAQAELSLSQGRLHPRHAERVVGRVPHQLGRRHVQPLRQASGEGQALDIAALLVQVPEDREQDLVGLVLLDQPLLGLLPPDLGDAALPVGLEQAQGRADDAAHERQQHQRGRDHPASIPPHELPDAIGRRRRARADRFMVGEPLDVVGQTDRRIVAPLTILGQRLHHDPVEIAANRSGSAGRAPCAGWRRGSAGFRRS